MTVFSSMTVILTCFVAWGRRGIPEKIGNLPRFGCGVLTLVLILAFC